MTRDPTTGRFVSREWVAPLRVGGYQALGDLGGFGLSRYQSNDPRYYGAVSDLTERQRLIDESVRASISEAASPPDRVHRYGTKYGLTALDVDAIRGHFRRLMEQRG